jgi:DNA-binding LacI/PurR family transcriptional regulator
MHPFRQRSLIEQIADHLRQGFRNGHWCGLLPGVGVLVRELGVSKATVEAALHLLEAEGSLESRGRGRRKQIILSRGSKGKARVLRVGIVMSVPFGQANSYGQQVMLGLIRRIENAGHTCFTSDRSLSELGYKLPRITRMLEAAKADAWVAYSPTADLVEWFVERSIPMIALGGKFSGLPVASSSTVIDDAIRASVRALSELGHRRIVAISPDSWRLPTPSITGQTFLSAMEECGHTPTSYNLPAWEQTPAGLEKLLHSLFLITPPTALIFVDPASFVTALGFLRPKEIRIPEDLSVVTLISGPMFSLLPKSPANFKWPIEEHIRRIVRWVKCVAKGGVDLNQVSYQASFEPGETLAPPKGLRKDGR